MARIAFFTEVAGQFSKMASRGAPRLIISPMLDLLEKIASLHFCDVALWLFTCEKLLRAMIFRGFMAF